MRSSEILTTAKRSLVLTGVALLCLATTSACASSNDSESPSPQGKNAPSSQSPPTSEAELSPKKEAARRATDTYLGMWQAMADAGHTSDWRSPELAKYATGNALTTITRSLYADHYNNVVTRGAPKNDPSVTSVTPPNNPTKVMIKDCGDSTNWLKYKEGTDELVDDSDGGRRTIVAEVKKQPDGTWKVTRFAVRGLGTC